MTRVLLTGANGRMAAVMRAKYAERYEEFRLLSRSEITDLHENETLYIGDIRNYEDVRAACEGIDIVLHFAAHSDEHSFEDILATNIVGTYNVYEAARNENIRRVVFASSNHVVGYYPTTDRVTADSLPRPDSFYGLSKSFGEDLARLYFDKWGIESVCLRIGSFRGSPEDRRQLSTWLSHRDGLDLIERAMEVPDVGFVIEYGVSRNDETWWELGAGADLLGYTPKDNSQDYVDEIDQNTSVPRYHGGVFADPSYRGGYY